MADNETAQVKGGVHIPDTMTRAGRKKAADDYSKRAEKSDKETKAKVAKNGGKKAAAKALDTDAEKKRVAAKPEGEQKKERRKSDDPLRVLARRAVEIAESGGSPLGSAITSPQATLLKDRLGSNPIGRFSPASIDQLLAYARGGRGEGRAELPAEASEKLREVARTSGDRRIWPRKIAAMALALAEAKGTEIPVRTKVEAET